MRFPERDGSSLSSLSSAKAGTAGPEQRRTRRTRTGDDAAAAAAAADEDDADDDDSDVNTAADVKPPTRPFCAEPAAAAATSLHELLACKPPLPHQLSTMELWLVALSLPNPAHERETREKSGLNGDDVNATAADDNENADDGDDDDTEGANCEKTGAGGGNDARGDAAAAAAAGERGGGRREERPGQGAAKLTKEDESVAKGE